MDDDDKYWRFDRGFQKKTKPPKVPNHDQDKQNQARTPPEMSVPYHRIKKPWQTGLKDVLDKQFSSAKTLVEAMELARKRKREFE